MNFEKLIENFERNNIHVILLPDRAAAKQYAAEHIPAGASVTHGGSVTLSECGIQELLRSGKYEYIDRAGDPDVYVKTLSADWYLTSSNAVTENGELYNVDGACNRITAMAFGPKHVLVIAGQNKVVPTLADAVKRVKEIAAPKNCVRLHKDTYCAKTGQCVSLNKKCPEMTDGCDSPDRICRHYLVSGKQKPNGRITLLLVQEDLGY